MVKCIHGKEDECLLTNSEKHCDKCNEYIPVCKSREQGDINYRCKRFNFILGECGKATLKICNICGMNNPKDFTDLMWFFEDYTMKKYK